MESFVLPNAKNNHVRCDACPIRERAVCAYCGGDDLALLDSMKNYRDFASGQELMAAGEPSSSVGSVVTGVVKLTKTLVDGRTQMVGLLFPGDFIGHPLRPIAEYDAVAATPVTLCAFQRAPFERLLRERPALETRLLRMTLDELDAARDWLLVLGRKTARERVASFLLMLARREVASPGETAKRSVNIDLPLSRAEIAEYLGMTIETVSRQLTKLRSNGVIAFESTRALRLPDLERLADEAGL